MSLGVQVPRRSALGVTWAEDTGRGRLGIRKNGGVFNGSCGLYPGGWIRTFAVVTSWLQYPHLLSRYKTEITVIASIRDFVASGTTQCIMAQASSVGWDGNVEWMLTTSATDKATFYLKRSGAAAIQVATIDDITAAPTQIAATWATDDNIRIFLDGEQNNAGALAAGSINDASQPLTVGLRANGDVPFSGGIIPEVVDYRKWTANEIRNYFRRSMFH